MEFLIVVTDLIYSLFLESVLPSKPLCKLCQFLDLLTIGNLLFFFHTGSHLMKLLACDVCG